MDIESVNKIQLSNKWKIWQFKGKIKMKDQNLTQQRPHKLQSKSIINLDNRKNQLKENLQIDCLDFIT